MNEILAKNINKLEELCRLHKVKTMYAFGSVSTDGFSDSSDIDLLVTFDEIPIEQYADNYFDLYDQLEQLFNRQIDLLTSNSLSNPYFIKSVEHSKRLLYERRD